MRNNEYRVEVIDEDDPRVIEWRVKHPKHAKNEDRVEELYEDDPRVIEWRVKHPKHAKVERPDLEKAILTAANGAAFGLLPEGAGQAAGQIRGLKEFVKDLIKKHKFTNPRSDAARRLNNKEYVKTMHHIQKDIDEYAEEHPTLSAIADMAGSIPAGIVLPGGNVARATKMLSKMGKAARAGAIYGGTRGLGERLNKKDNIEETINAMLKGGLAGGVTGGALGGVLSPFTTSKFQKLKQSIGRINIEEGLKNNAPLLENTSIKVRQYAQGIKNRGNHKALQRFKNFKEKMENEQKQKIYKIIEDNISSKDYDNTLNRVIQEGESIYSPLYKEAEKAGEIPRPRTQDSEVLKDYIKKARKYSDDLKGLSDNNVALLKRVEEKINDDITVKMNSGYKSDARDLEILKKRLQNDIDETVLKHSEANKAYSKTKRQEEALKRGVEDVPKASLRKIKAISNIDLPPAELQELQKSGAAQYFRERTFNKPRTDVDLFKDAFPDDDLEKMVYAKILSPDQIKKIKRLTSSLSDSMANIRELGNREINVKKETNPAKWVTNTARKLRETSNNLYEKFVTRGDARAAKYLTNPRALRLALKRDMRRSGVTLDDMIYRILSEQKGRKKREEE
jgi:hypothetical protein